MKKLKILFIALGVTALVSSCALTEDGIVPQDGLLKTKASGAQSSGVGAGPIPPPPPPPVEPAEG